MKDDRKPGDIAAGRIENVLGPLGAAVMRAAYDQGEVSVSTILPRLREMQGRASAYTTVMTILSRLHDRGLLVRRKVGRQYVYRPSADETTTIERLSEQAVDDVLAKYGTAAIRQFAERMAELDADLRAQLLALAESTDPK